MFQYDIGCDETFYFVAGRGWMQLHRTTSQRSKLFNYEFRRRSKMKQREATYYVVPAQAAARVWGAICAEKQNFAEHRRLFPSSRRQASKEVKSPCFTPAAHLSGNRGVCNDGVISGDGRAAVGGRNTFIDRYASIAMDKPEFRLIDRRRLMAAILGGCRLGYERTPMSVG